MKKSYISENVLKNLTEHCQGPKDAATLLESLTKIYLEAAPVTMLAIETSVISGQRPKVQQEVHRLKGMCLNLGAVELAALCNELEQGAMSLSPERAKDLTEKIRVTFDGVLAEARQIYLANAAQALAS